MIAKALGGMFSEAAVTGAIEAASKVQADPSSAKSLEKAAGPPPNLRDASTSLERCASCCLANNPDCVKYGGWDVRPDQTCDGWSLAIPGDVTKATEVDDVRQAAIDALKAKADISELEKVLTELHGDSLLQGAHDAAEAAHVPVVASLADVADSVPGGYWDSWVPGYGEAAAQAADGGMRALLDGAGHTIVGLEDTTIDRIGQMVSEGLGRGDSIQTVGKAIRAEVEAPARAELIANTEYARAMTTASEQTYAESGVVEEEEWLGEGDMCPECQVNADASPIKQGDDWPNGSVPVHPRCRCAQAGKVSVPGE